jgi:hypothetical protein
MANMNRSRKRHQQGRKVPSSKRTPGRIKRHEQRKFDRQITEPSAGVAFHPDFIAEVDGKLVVGDFKGESRNEAKGQGRKP